MFPEGASGMALSRHMMDRSFTLEHLLAVCYQGSHGNLLAELQLAFVCFLIGQVYDGEVNRPHDPQTPSNPQLPLPSPPLHSLYHNYISSCCLC